MENRIRTKRLAFAAIMTGFSVVLLAAGVYLPSGRAAALGLAGLPVLLLDMALGRKYSLMSVAASSLLTFFLGGMATALAFLFFFGSYPVVKDFLQAKLYERKKLIYILKFAYFNAAMLLLYCLASSFFLSLPLASIAPWKIVCFAIGANIVFFLYDKAIGRCGAMLFFRLGKYIDQLL